MQSAELSVISDCHVLQAWEELTCRQALGCGGPHAYAPASDAQERHIADALCCPNQPAWTRRQPTTCPKVKISCRLLPNLKSCFSPGRHVSSPPYHRCATHVNYWLSQYELSCGPPACRQEATCSLQRHRTLCDTSQPDIIHADHCMTQKAAAGFIAMSHTCLIKGEQRVAHDGNSQHTQKTHKALYACVGPCRTLGH